MSTAGIYFKWQTYDDTEVRAVYRIVGGDVLITSTINAMGEPVELSDDERNDLVIDIEAERGLGTRSAA